MPLICQLCHLAIYVWQQFKVFWTLNSEFLYKWGSESKAHIYKDIGDQSAKQ